jgi:hypothetical protein
VEYDLCVPGASVQVARTFSKTKRQWLPDKIHLCVPTLPSLTTIKPNFNENCQECYAKLQKTFSAEEDTFVAAVSLVLG